MNSKTAQADVEEMWEAGLKPTFADIIRLNALALNVERIKAGFSISELPRVAFLGNVAFRETTVGSEIWLAEASQLFDLDEPETYIILRAFSLSRPQGELPDPADEKAVIAGVQAFKDALAFATLRQVVAATGYAIHGFSPDAGERAAERKDLDKEAERADDCYEVGLMRSGMLYRIGSAADLRDLPPRALSEMVRRAMSRDHGANMRKDAVSDAEDDYLRTLDEITARLKREITDPEAVVEQVVNQDEGIDTKDKVDDRDGEDDSQNGDDEHGEMRGHVATDVGGCLISHGENSPSLKAG